VLRNAGAIILRPRQAGKGIIGEGRFCDDDQKRDHSVRWVMGLGSVDMMAVGFEKPEEVDDFKDRVRRALEAGRRGRGSASVDGPATHLAGELARGPASRTRPDAC
jgi:hypothetical protein